MIVELTLEDAVDAITKPHGPSKGDRCCLALGRRLALPVVHAERRWQRLPDEIGVERVLVRGATGANEVSDSDRLSADD